MKKILGREDESILQIQAKDGIVLITILELMPYVVVVDEELVGHLLVSDGTDGGEELIGIKGVKLRLEELRAENILVAEGGCTDVEDGISPHIGKARLPPLHEGIEPYCLQSHLLQENRIL